MDRANHKPESTAPQHRIRSLPTAGEGARGLRLVSTGLRLAAPVEASDPAWADAMAQLLRWLDVALEPVAPRRSAGLGKVADWARAAGVTAGATQFAPWQAISPVALQQAASPELPRADWVASYLFDHGQGNAARSGALDLMLMSAHPARCEAEQEGEAPLPRPAIVEAMIRAARAEGRCRIAIIVPARQRNAAARQLLLADRTLTREEGLSLEIVAIEQALGGMLTARPRWDAMIVSPELRSIVFAMLAQATGLAAPLPMLWHAGSDLVLVASELLGEAGARVPMDAAVLVQALALTLRHSGMTAAALRLHESSAQLRDSGIVTASRGSPAPYVTEVDDAQFVQLVCAGAQTGRRPVPQWLALPDLPVAGTSGAPVRLTLVAENSSSPVS
ncbi:MAG: hypothetical protein V2I74_07605 [Erythrobacter sp.]|jgi:hypothetical protein|nr:hypothetical protein [Erythrobacter sp.]